MRVRMCVSATVCNSDIFLHSDASFMPRRKAAWSAWNFRGTVRGRVCVTYWLNTLQVLRDTASHHTVLLDTTLHCYWIVLCKSSS